MKINQRLFDHYGIDTAKDLGVTMNCPRPFDTLLIDKMGSCYACECTSWLPQSLGNLNIQPLDKLVNNEIAKKLQQSILDGSYRYCNNRQCAYLLDARYKGVPFDETVPLPVIKHIRLAIDDSCNLSCPSCRTKKIFESDKSRLRKKQKLADRIIDYVRAQTHQIRIHVGSDGDPFASLVYRYFVSQSKDLPNVRFTIQTNGLLIKKMLHRHRALFEKLDVLNISIDGATKKTYELLRRGGSYEKIIENLEVVKEIKSKFDFKFIMHYVVQSENYREMETMAELGEKYNADRLWFNRINDWSTYDNFRSKDVLDDRHPQHGECLKVIEKIKKRSTPNNLLIEMPTILSNPSK